MGGLINIRLFGRSRILAGAPLGSGPLQLFALFLLPRLQRRLICFLRLCQRLGGLINIRLFGRDRALAGAPLGSGPLQLFVLLFLPRLQRRLICFLRLFQRPGCLINIRLLGRDRTLAGAPLDSGPLQLFALLLLPRPQRSLIRFLRLCQCPGVLINIRLFGCRFRGGTLRFFPGILHIRFGPGVFHGFLKGRIRLCQRRLRRVIVSLCLLLRGPGLFHIPQVNWQPVFQLRLGFLCLAQLRFQILELFCRSFHLRLDVIQFAFRFTPNGIFFPPSVFFLFRILLRQTGSIHCLVGKRLFRLAAFAVDATFRRIQLLGQASARPHSRPQLRQNLIQFVDEGCRVLFRELHVRLGLGGQCLTVQVVGQRFQLRGRLIRGLGIGGYRLDVLGDVVSHLAPGDIHAEHLPVAKGGGLHQKAGLVRHQIAVGFLHHGAAGEHIGPGYHARDELVVVSADEQQHRQHQVRAQRQRIDVIHAYIALYFQCEGPGDGLAPHMDVVV